MKSIERGLTYFDSTVLLIETPSILNILKQPTNHCVLNQSNLARSKTVERKDCKTSAMAVAVVASSPVQTPNDEMTLRLFVCYYYAFTFGSYLSRRTAAE